ncbi:hypothetical protein [Xanthocytophaga flava]|uniref:hypothetical protein n=1 Tax=Xanthocytophaga flava TaxID=3048013 RepID=UPI0028D6A520|nr:hypothetical protein [Xanthocytophaga flavus]MDJ1467847.1 hypothetical protein [Xanthocytophaga flavus]
MSKNSLTTAFVLTLAVLFFSACDEIIPKFSDTPKITFDKIDIRQNPTARIDTLRISLKFQDGDGDIGSDTKADTSKWNFFFTPYKKFRGEFVTVIIDSASKNDFTRGTIPVLKPDGRKGPIEGTITWIIPAITQVEEFPLTPEDSMKFLFNDIVKFKVKIKDEAGHFSNEVESDEVQILKPR